MFRKKQYIEINQLTKLLKNPPNNLFVPIYGKIKKGRANLMEKKKKPKYTLNQLGETVDKLVVTVSQLAEEMRDGFKQVNTRIDRIDTRLDYVVKANNLKDLSRNR